MISVFQVNDDKEYAKDKEYAYHNLSLVVSFVRHAEEDLLGIKKRKARTDANVSAQEREKKKLNFWPGCARRCRRES